MQTSPLWYEARNTSHKHHILDMAAMLLSMDRISPLLQEESTSAVCSIASLVGVLRAEYKFRQNKSECAHAMVIDGLVQS